MTDLYPEWRVGAISLTEAPYAVPFGGVDYGTPENVTEILRSLLQDGDIELSSRSGNRTLVLPVLIEDADMAALAAAEAALVLECDKPRNEVYVDPGDGFGTPFIFDVFRGQLTFARDDTYEQNGFRSYSLEFRALPYPKSVDEVIAPALAVGSGSTSVDSGSSATGWTATVNGGAVTPNVVSGAVGYTTAGADGAMVALTLTRAGSFSTSTQKYLTIDWGGSFSIGSNYPLVASADGVLLEQVAQFQSPTAGYMRTVFFVAAASVSTLTLSHSSYVAAPGYVTAPLARLFRVDQITTVGEPPAVGTRRQLIRSVDVAGSARSVGSLAVEHETSALGDVLIYTWPDDYISYTPPLRTYFRTGGGTTTTDTSLVSGARDAGSSEFRVPMRQLPQGRYVVMARVRSDTGSGTPVDYTITTDEVALVNPAGTPTGASDPVSLSTTASLTGTTWKNVVLGALQLPSANVSPSSSNIFSYLIVTGANVQFDEVWLFNLSIGQLTAVSLGTGSPGVSASSNRLYLTPASVDNPVPTLRRGYTADGSDSYHARGAASWMEPQFTPPRINVLTVTSNATDAEASFSHFPHWHTHAAS